MEQVEEIVTIKSLAREYDVAERVVGRRLRQNGMSARSTRTPVLQYSWTHDSPELQGIRELTKILVGKYVRSDSHNKP